MKKKMLRIVNLLIFLVLVYQLSSGLFGESSGVRWFEESHNYTGIALGVLVIVHLILNWEWVKMQVKRKK